MSLPDGKNIHECYYWQRNNGIPGRDILEAFENYLEGKLTKEFESCKGNTEPSMKISIAERIGKIKFEQRRS